MKEINFKEEELPVRVRIQRRRGTVIEKLVTMTSKGKVHVLGADGPLPKKCAK